MHPTGCFSRSSSFLSFFFLTSPLSFYLLHRKPGPFLPLFLYPSKRTIKGDEAKQASHPSRDCPWAHRVWVKGTLYIYVQKQNSPSLPPSFHLPSLPIIRLRVDQLALRLLRLHLLQGMAEVGLEGRLHLLQVRGQVLLLEGNLDGALDAAFAGELVFGGEVVDGFDHRGVFYEEVLVTQACRLRCGWEKGVGVGG